MNTKKLEKIGVIIGVFLLGITLKGSVFNAEKVFAYQEGCGNTSGVGSCPAVGSSCWTCNKPAECGGNYWCTEGIGVPGIGGSGLSCHCDTGGGGGGGGTSDNTAKGWQDTPDNSVCSVYGWTCDKDKYSAHLDAEIYEVLPTPVFLGTTSASLPGNNATDVSNLNAACGNTSDHRFAFYIPASLRDGNPHNIRVNGVSINSAGGIVRSNPLPNGNPKTITCSSSTRCGLLIDPQCKFETGSVYSVWWTNGTQVSAPWSVYQQEGTTAAPLGHSGSVHVLKAVYTGKAVSGVPIESSLYTVLRSAPPSNQEALFTGFVKVVSSTIATPGTLRACVSHWKDWSSTGGYKGSDCANINVSASTLGTWQSYTIHSPRKTTDENNIVVEFHPSASTGTITFYVDDLNLTFGAIPAATPTPTRTPTPSPTPTGPTPTVTPTPTTPAVCIPRFTSPADGTVETGAFTLEWRTCPGKATEINLTNQGTSQSVGIAPNNLSSISVDPINYSVLIPGQSYILKLRTCDQASAGLTNCTNPGAWGSPITLWWQYNPTVCQDYAKGNVTCDLDPNSRTPKGLIDIKDLSEMLTQWSTLYGPTTPTPTVVPPHRTADINGSGKVDVYDMTTLLTNWTIQP